jgi:hypothetical protein
MVDPLRPSPAPGVPPVETRPGLTAAVATALAEAQALEPPAPATSPAAVVAAARAEAAGQQAGLGPVLANLEQTLSSNALPADVKAAVARVLALRLPTDAPVTAETVRQAVASSGLFLEARLAAGSAPPMDLKAALLVLQQALAPMAARAAARSQKPGPPPPTPGGALTGQPPARPTLDLGAEPDALIPQLRGEVEQALARQTLHQLASRPDGANAHWMFELPLATPQGPAIAQFAIDRDDAARSGADEAPAWQTRFSLDLPPLGPVHVSLRMDGERTAVTMWAEDPEGLERLRSRGGELAGALAAEVVFRPGSPRPPEPPLGRLVDRSS